jgi:hypothetical protein
MAVESSMADDRWKAIVSCNDSEAIAALARNCGV